MAFPPAEWVIKEWPLTNQQAYPVLPKGRSKRWRLWRRCTEHTFIISLSREGTSPCPPGSHSTCQRIVLFSKSRGWMEPFHATFLPAFHPRPPDMAHGDFFVWRVYKTKHWSSYGASRSTTCCEGAAIRSDEDNTKGTRLVDNNARSKPLSWFGQNNNTNTQHGIMHHQKKLTFIELKILTDANWR